MQKFIGIALLLGLLSLPLMAQDKVEVFGGYQYLNIGSTTNGPSSSQGFNGWDAAAAFKFSRYLGIEGDFSGSYATINGVSYKIYTYSGGPLISAPVCRVKPFAHALIGGIHLSGSESSESVSWDGYTVMAGGGFDVKVNRALAVRLLQADWVYYNFSSTSAQGLSLPGFSGSKNVRIATGIVLRF